MKIALTQLNYYVGDFEKNISKIKHSIQSAKKQKVDLIVFAEMAVCGFPPYDLLHYDSFVGKCQQAIADIAVECTEIAAIIGAPYVNNDEFGKTDNFLSEKRYCKAGAKAYYDKSSPLKCKLKI
jgi:NAD+ synthase (glutamine-hydrolysing)